jgi:hypothetical protein
MKVRLEHFASLFVFIGSYRYRAARAAGDGGM